MPHCHLSPLSSSIADVWHTITFQREFSLFLPLSVDEYQTLEVRIELFERFLHKYLGYSEKQDQEHFDEKVTTKIKLPGN